jgi:adenylate kinase
MKIVLIGIQGAGKSTQGNLLSEKLKIPYLSTGHIFREMAKEKTPEGRYIKETINAGFLIPNHKTLSIVNEYLSRQEYQAGYILDGFPRTTEQAREFKEKIDHVFYLEVSDKEALWRISGRDDERDDETLKAIRRRIELFHEHTKPVLDFYHDKRVLVRIDGEQKIEEISKEILEKLQNDK